MHVGACARLPVVEGDLQRFETVVVVGEERNLEATVATKEVSTLTVGYGTHAVVVHQLHSIVEHVDAIVRQLVFVLEVDAEQFAIMACMLKTYI